MSEVSPVFGKDMPLGTAFSCRSLTGLAMIEQLFVRNGGYHVRTCLHCGQYFVAFSRRQRFCSRINPDSVESCEQVGPMKFYRQTVNADPVLKSYEKHYKTYHAWVKVTKKKIEADDYGNSVINSDEVLKDIDEKFNNWCALVGNARKQYLAGEMDSKAALTKIRLPKVPERSLRYQAWHNDQRSRQGL